MHSQSNHGDKDQLCLSSIHHCPCVKLLTQAHWMLWDIKSKGKWHTLKQLAEYIRHRKWLDSIRNWPLAFSRRSVESPMNRCSSVGPVNQNSCQSKNRCNMFSIKQSEI